MSQKIALFKNVIIFGSATFLEMILSYFFIVVMGKQLGPAGLGQYYYLITLVSTVALLCLINDNSLLQKKIAQDDSGVSSSVAGFFLIRMMICIVSVAIILVLAATSARGADFKIAMRYSTILAASLIMNDLLSGIAKAHQSILALSAVKVLERCLAVALLFSVIFMTRITIPRCFMILGFASLTQAVVLFVLLRRFLRWPVAINLRGLGQLLFEGLPYFLNGAFFMIYFRIDVLIVGWLTSDKETGYYSAAQQLYQICLLTISIVTAVVFPPLVAMFNKGRERFAVITTEVGKFLAFYTVGICFGLLMLARKIIYFIFEDQMMPSVDVLQVFAVILFFAIFLIFFNMMLVVINKQVLSSVIFGVTACFQVFACYFMTVRFSFHGTLYATAASTFLGCVLTAIALKRALKFRLTVLPLLKLLLAALIMSTILYWLRNQLTLFPLIFVGLVSYCGAIFGLRYFSIHELSFLKHLTGYFKKYMAVS